MNSCLWNLLFQIYRLDSEVMWQVDMDGMSHIFSSFISFLQLEDVYNIIVLNPKRNATRANYGYRYAYLCFIENAVLLCVCRRLEMYRCMCFVVFNYLYT